jgi:hypothetical protein
MLKLLAGGLLGIATSGCQSFVDAAFGARMGRLQFGFERRHFGAGLSLSGGAWVGRVGVRRPLIKQLGGYPFTGQGLGIARLNEFGQHAQL